MSDLKAVCAVTGSRGAAAVEEVRVEELEAAEIVEVDIAGLSGGTEEAEGGKAVFSWLSKPIPKLPLPPPPPLPPVVLLNFLRKGLLELREAISGGEEGGGGEESKSGFHIYNRSSSRFDSRRRNIRDTDHRQGIDRGEEKKKRKKSGQ